MADEASCTVAESDTHHYYHCAPMTAAAAAAEAEEVEKTPCQMHPETWVEFRREPTESRRHLHLMNVEATASVMVAAAEAYYAALGLDPMDLLYIRRLSLLAATS